jgi:transmembrane 9 superfamily protein 3
MVIEIYYILARIWLNARGYAWQYLFLGLLLNICASAWLSGLLVYFLFQHEVHLWHWASFEAPATSGLFVYAYSIWFLVAKTQITGIFETLYYLIYMLVFSLSISLIIGAFGFCGSSLFIEGLFSNRKLD